MIYSVSASGFLPVQWERVDAKIVQGGNQIDWTLHQSLGIEYFEAVSYTHLRAHETVLDLVCRLLLEKKKMYTHNMLIPIIS